MNPDTLQALDQMFREFPFLKGGEVPLDEIDQAAKSLGVPFQEDYVEFVRKFGGGIVGPYPIFGLREVPAMGRAYSVIDVTNEFRRDRWPGTDKWVVFSEDHSGNPIGFDRDGGVFVSDHDFGQIAAIADSFEAYLRKKCLNLEP